MPSFFPRSLYVAALLVCAGFTTSCLVKSSRRTEVPVITRTATLGQLVAKLERFGDIESMKAYVELRLSVENEEHTRVQEFRDAPGYILAKRPSDIRAIAQLPVVRTTAFEMASNGEQFQVSLPSRKRFLVGQVAQTEHSEKRIENIRPQPILDALLIEPPQKDEVAVLENVSEGVIPYQVITLIRPDGKQPPTLTRKFWFNRETLDLSRIQIYDSLGNPMTIVTYELWAEESTLPYPQIAMVTRPGDGYSLRIHILEPGLNETLPKDSFVLQAPPGVEVEHINAKTTTGQAEEHTGEAAR